MSSSNSLLEVKGVSASWDGLPVLRSVSFTVAPNEFLVLLGPNGSGKSTLLRTIAGLERPTEGRIFLSGDDITDVPPHRRGVGLMFQDPALFPHRSVYENIAYAPLLQRRPRAEVEEEVGRLVSLLHLGLLVDRRPDQLSGGEHQRVALARTLAAQPRLVLLDEPFASIDIDLKAELRSEFRRILSSLGIAAIHVTHDREEGLFLGDRLGLLFDGRLETIDLPTSVFDHPRTVRAARFLGYNVVPSPTGLVGVHPSDLRIDGTSPTGLPCTVLAAGTTGREALWVLRSDEGERLELRAPTSPGSIPVGSRVSVRWDRSVPLLP